MIAFIRADTCRGCGIGVNIWWDGVRPVIRNRSVTWAPIHCCDDPEKREYIELDYPDLVAFRCPTCGDPDTAPTSWGRIVDFPSDPALEAWAEAWVGPLQPHVCVTTSTASLDGASIVAFRVWPGGNGSSV